MAETTHPEIARGLAEVKASLAAMHIELKAVADKVDETRDIVEAWQAVKTGGKVITWVAKVGAAVLAIFALVKVGATGIVDLGGKP